MVLGDIEITISAGNTGDIGSSFKITGKHPQSNHDFNWVSDPAAGESNFMSSD